MKINSLIHVDKNESLPIYQQIANSLSISISSGKLKHGDRIPGLRSISAQTGIAINTISKALGILVEHGIIKAEPRSGFRVVRREIPIGRYENRGVSTEKRDVHAVIRKMKAGLFPDAFCKITPDYLSGDPTKCAAIHSDGSGTKSIVAYLHYKETGDASVFKGIAHDSIVMNLDDLLCIGAVDQILISSTINRNAKRCPGEVVAALIEGTEEALEKIRSFGISIFSGGGETADVGDLTGTVVVDTCTVTTMPRNQVIDNANIHAGLAIVGLSSSGKATYETAENSGIASNGLTSARHDLLSSYYSKKYPETTDRAVNKSMIYCGRFRLEDELPSGKGMSIGEALLSPTRTYAPIISNLLNENRAAIKGMVHCSGGAQTKCLRFGNGVHYIKDDLFKTPEVFELIERESKTQRKEMLQVFNMGHRMEIYCEPKNAEWVIEVSKAFGVHAKVIGRTERAKKNLLSIRSGGKTYSYSL